jgi:UMF1 family MFS transporter
MTPSQLIIVGVLTPTAGIIGALVWPRIQHVLGWSNLRVLMVLVSLASLIPAYGCLGFIPFFGQGKARFGGLTTQEEMYGLAVYFGWSLFIMVWRHLTVQQALFMEPSKDMPELCMRR